MSRKLFQIFEKLIEHKITFVFQGQGQAYYNIGLDIPDEHKKATKQKTVYVNSPNIQDIEDIAVKMYGHLLNEKSKDPLIVESVSVLPEEIFKYEPGPRMSPPAMPIPTMPLPPGM